MYILKNNKMDIKLLKEPSKIIFHWPLNLNSDTTLMFGKTRAHAFTFAKNDDVQLRAWTSVGKVTREPREISQIGTQTVLLCMLHGVLFEWA